MKLSAVDFKMSSLFFFLLRTLQHVQNRKIFCRLAYYVYLIPIIYKISTSNMKTIIQYLA